MPIKPPIKSIKHYVHFPAATVVSGAIGNFKPIDAIAEGAARATAANVEEGCEIKAVFVEMWMSGQTVDNTIGWALYKIPSGGAGTTAAQLSNMSTYQNKKNVLKFGQGLGPTSGNVVPVLREWIKIPKGKQRFGLGDEFVFSFTGTGTSAHACGFATYKEYN